MSKLRADQIVDRAGTASPLFPEGLRVTGVATATSFSGNATGLTGNPDVTVGKLTINNDATVGGALTVTGNLKVDGRIAIGKEHIAESPNSFEITFNHNNNYDNWLLFDTINDDGNIPEDSDWIIEYEHKITKGNGNDVTPAYSHFGLVIEGPDGIPFNSFASNTYFMYYADSSWDSVINFR